jgi:BspA type Leucine rich repeat region (6 copies)
MMARPFKTTFRALILFLVFAGMTGRAQVNYGISGNTVYVTNSASASGDVVIASTYNGHPVTSIADSAFEGNLSLTNVIIPASVTSIGNSVFINCSNLTSVTFLGNAPSLGTDDFSIINGYWSGYWTWDTVGNDWYWTWVWNSTTPAIVYYYYGTSGWGQTYGVLPTVELAYTPQIGGGGVRGQSGGFGFPIIGTNGMTVIVEASTNLVNWSPVWTNTLAGPSTNFIDSSWMNYLHRYYRTR